MELNILKLKKFNIYQKNLSGFWLGLREIYYKNPGLNLIKKLSGDGDLK
jgi:hypothetical protein